MNTWTHRTISARSRSTDLRPIRIAASVALLAALLSQDVCSAEPKPETWVWNDPKDLKISGLRHSTFESESMKRTVGFSIYLPPQYEQEPNRRFPVVYFLHGAGGTESSDAGLAGRVRAEIIGGRIAPVIYVFPNGGKESGYRDWTNAIANVKSETLVIRELLPLIDHDYRTLAQPATRGICGFSMGGGASMRFSMKYPELFGAAASLAAALDKAPDDTGGDNCYRHAAALSQEQRDRLRLYLVVGEDDFLFPRHEPFLKHLKSLGIRYTSVVHSKVGHDLGALNELSADAMIRHLDHEMRPQHRKTHSN